MSNAADKAEKERETLKGVLLDVATCRLYRFFEQGEQSAIDVLEPIIKRLEPILFITNPTLAIWAVFERAIAKLPDEAVESYERQPHRITWRELGFILYDRTNNPESSYKKRYRELKVKLGIDANADDSTLRRRVSKLREKLADILLDLKPLNSLDESAEETLGIPVSSSIRTQFPGNPPAQKIPTPPFPIPPSHPLELLKPDPTTKKRIRRPTTRVVAVVAVTVILATAVAVTSLLIWPSDSPGTPGQFVALQAIPVSITAYDGSYNAAFGPDKETTALAYRAQYDHDSSNADQLFKEILREGGYAQGGLVLTLQVKSLIDKQVVVTGAHIVNERCDAPVTNKVAFTTPAERPIPRFGFDLDSNPSIARTVETEDGSEQLGADYFSLERIGVRYGTADEVTVSFKISKQACSFNLALEYRVDGQQRPPVYVPKSVQDNAPLQLGATG